MPSSFPFITSLPLLLLITITITISILIPCTLATLFNPQLQAHTSIPNPYSQAQFNDIALDDQYIYINVGMADSTIMVLNYSHTGQVSVFRYYTFAAEPSDMFTLINGVIVVTIEDGDNTIMIVIDVTADISKTYSFLRKIKFYPFWPKNSQYALYALAGDSAFFLAWSETDIVNAELIPITVPAYDWIFFSTYLYILQNDQLCSYSYPPELIPIGCIDLQLTSCCSSGGCPTFIFSISPSGERISVTSDFDPDANQYCLLMLDVTENGFELFTDLNFPRFSTYQLSYHGDFMLSHDKYLFDISSGQANLLYDFGNFYTYYNNLCGISPNDNIIFYIAYRKDDETFQIFSFDVTPLLTPALRNLVGSFDSVLNSIIGDNKLVLDETAGMAFLPSRAYPFVFVADLDSLNSQNAFSEVTSADSDCVQGLIFKEPNCLWFSKTVPEYRVRNEKDLTLTFIIYFFLFNPDLKEFYNTVTVFPVLPFIAPVVSVAHKLWVGPAGDLFVAVVWARAASDVANGYVNSSLYVYYFPSNTSFPVYIQQPHASFELTECILPFISSYIEQAANVYVALWSDDVTTAENLAYEGGLNFSIVVGTPNGSAFNWMNFSFVVADSKLTVTQSAIVNTDCMLLQSMRINNSTWILCVDTDREYQVMKYTNDIVHPKFHLMTHTVFDKAFEFNFNWWISADEKRLGFANSSGIFMFDTETYRNKYILASGFAFETGGIYHSKLPESTYVLVLEDDLFYDCGPGYKPSHSNFCSKCPPGTYGLGCLACPAGFVCDEYGLAVPTKLCPAGYYCETGTKTIKFGAENGPQPCLAGSYCPSGTITSVVGTDRLTPKPCMARFYCPAASTLPTAVACPEKTYSENGAKTIHDCFCENGYFGVDGVCLKCLAQCNCFRDVISDCWVPSNFTNTTVPLLCPINSVIGSTACNPNKTVWQGGTSFPCAPGYGDRQCSKCEYGYFSAGRACKPCGGGDVIKLLPVLYLVVVMLMLAYAWNIQPVNSATLKIIVVHFQTLLIFILGGMEWDTLTSKFVHSSASSFNFSISAIECLFPEWTLMHSLVVTVLLPVVIAVCVVVSGIIVCGVTRFKDRITCLRQRRHLLDAENTITFASLKLQMAKTMVTLVDLLYFSVALMAFQMFGCVSTTEGSYLTSYPWLRCATKTWRPYVGIASVALVLEVILPPIALMIALRMNKNLLLRKKTKTILGSFYLVYSHDNYLWECVVITKRLVIAFLSTIIPYGNIVLYIALFIVFHLYGIVLLRKMPYVNKKDNIMDLASQVILLSTLYCGFFVNFAIPSYQQIELSYFAGVVNLAFMVIGGLCILFEKLPLALVQIGTLIRSCGKSPREPLGEYNVLPLEDFSDMGNIT